MVSWGRLITVLIAGLIVSVTVHADMMPVAAVDMDGRQSVEARRELQAQPMESASLCDWPNVADLKLEPIQLSPEAGIDLGWPSQTQPPQVLTDGQSSLSLCLSALIGLGLCSSAHCVKRLSFGFVPEWYQNGGPFRIGHSIAVNPVSICPAPVCCFVQPGHTAEDVVLQYRTGTVVSLWRKSQFTLDTLAARGPPLQS